MAAAERKESGFNIVTVGLCLAASVIFLYAVSLFLQGGFQAELALEYDAKTNGFPDEARAAYVAEQQAILDERVRWLDEEQGTACMPVDDAIDRLVATQADR